MELNLGVSIKKIVEKKQVQDFGIQGAIVVKGDQLQYWGILQCAKTVVEDQFQGFGIHGAKTIGKNQCQYLGIQVAKEVKLDQLQSLGIQVAKTTGSDQIQIFGIQCAKTVGGNQIQTFGGLNIILGKGNQKAILGLNCNLGHYKNSQSGLFNYSRDSGFSVGSNLYSRIREARANLNEYSPEELDEIGKSNPSLLNELSFGKYHTISDLERRMLRKYGF